jgi:hypothetical protein
VTKDQKFQLFHLPMDPKYKFISYQFWVAFFESNLYHIPPNPDQRLSLRSPQWVEYGPKFASKMVHKPLAWPHCDITHLLDWLWLEQAWSSVYFCRYNADNSSLKSINLVIFFMSSISSKYEPKEVSYSVLLH